MPDICGGSAKRDVRVRVNRVGHFPMIAELNQNAQHGSATTERSRSEKAVSTPSRAPQAP